MSERLSKIDIPARMSTMKQNESYKVLSLDGGGMRGLYAASVLKSLVSFLSQSNHDKDIGKGFDLIVGTSTGGILACGLAAGISIDEIIKLYSQEGKKIFTNPFPPEKAKEQLLWGLQSSRKSANSNKILIEELEKIFGRKTMGQISYERQIGLCITAVNLIDHSPRVFKTPHNLSEKADSDRLLIDVCLATSSAPILLPVANIPTPERNNIYEHFVDGGLWANNPILVALIEAIACSKENQKIEIISVGTCPPPTGKMVLNKNEEGLIKWRFGIDLMELTMDSQAKASHFIADFLCNQTKKYLKKEVKIHRLKQTTPSVEQTPFLSLDQASERACSILMELGKKDGQETYEEINTENNNHILKEIFSNLPDLKDIT